MKRETTAAPLFRERRQQARLLAELTYVNPFLPDRIRLESQVLGSNYVSLEREWNVDPRSFGENNPNIRAIKELAKSLLQLARAEYIAGKGSVEERDIYRSIAYFSVYHEHIQNLDRTIALAAENPSQQTKLQGFKAILRDIEEDLGKLSDDTNSDTEAHLLALFYQLRRAFHNIFRFFVGTSEPATRLRSRIWESIFTHDLRRYRRALHSRMREVSTLVTGPSGSGKEVVARAIALSQYLPFDRQSGTFASLSSLFMPVNVAALSQTLIESELFGHRKGSFTGAFNDRRGYFEICGEHGAVFLDEIGETPMGVQVKLLRVLQERKFQRVGDTEERSFEGKVIAATNRNLQEEIAHGRFREDLYYRLCSDIVQTPSLAEIVAQNPEELGLLARHVSDRLVGSDEGARLCEEVVGWAQRHGGYKWPGNFRELEQAVKNILVHGNYEPKDSNNHSNAINAFAGPILPAEEIIKQYVKHAFAETGNYSEAARLLQLDRRTVKRYLDAADSPA